MNDQMFQRTAGKLGVVINLRKSIRPDTVSMVEVCAREHCVCNLDGGNVSYFAERKCLFQTNAEGMSEFSDSVSLSGSKAPPFGKEE